MNIRPEDVSSRLVIALHNNPDIISVVSNDMNFDDNSDSYDRMVYQIKKSVAVQSVACVGNTLTLTVSPYVFHDEYMPRVIDAVIEHGVNVHAGPDDDAPRYKPTLFLHSRSNREAPDMGISNIHPWIA